MNCQDCNDCGFIKPRMKVKKNVKDSDILFIFDNHKSFDFDIINDVYGGSKYSYTFMVNCEISNPDEGNYLNCFQHLMDDVKKSNPQIVICVGKSVGICFGFFETFIGDFKIYNGVSKKTFMIPDVRFLKRYPKLHSKYLKFSEYILKVLKID